MSMPNIPDINPDICLCFNDVINLLLSSVALQEIALSNIINAESEKLQAILKRKDECYSIKDLVGLNVSIEKVLYEVCSIENLLITKLKFIDQISSNKNSCELYENCFGCDEEEEPEYDDSDCDCYEGYDGADDSCECNYDHMYNANTNHNMKVKADNHHIYDNHNNGLNDSFSECDCYYVDTQSKHKNSNENKAKMQYNHIKKIKTNNEKFKPNANDLNSDVKNEYKNTYNSDFYHKNYNKVSSMLNKIMGRRNNPTAKPNEQ